MEEEVEVGSKVGRKKLNKLVKKEDRRSEGGRGGGCTRKG